MRARTDGQMDIQMEKRTQRSDDITWLANAKGKNGGNAVRFINQENYCSKGCWVSDYPDTKPTF